MSFLQFIESCINIHTFLEGLLKPVPSVPRLHLKFPIRQRKIETLGSFSNDNGDGNEDGNTTTLRVHDTFLHISLPSLHDYDVKCLISRLVVNVNKRGRIFLSLSKLESGPQETNSREIRLHFTFSVNWNKRDKV